MKVLLFGAGGRIGSVILSELVARGHQVTAAFRTTTAAMDVPANVTPIAADVTDAKAVATSVNGHAAVISAVGPGQLKDATVIEAAADALIEGLESAKVTTAVIVGGAGTLELRPGVMRLDDPSYPEIYRVQGLRQKAALEAFRRSTLDWTYISPPIVIGPGPRTGHYRVGGDSVLADASGKSAISFEDFALRAGRRVGSSSGFAAADDIRVLRAKKAALWGGPLIRLPGGRLFGCGDRI